MSFKRVLNNYLSIFKPEEDSNLRLIKLLFVLSPKLQSLELLEEPLMKIGATYWQNLYRIKRVNEGNLIEGGIFTNPYDYTVLNISITICDYLRNIPSTYFKREDLLAKEEEDLILKAFFGEFKEEGVEIINYISNCSTFAPAKALEICFKIKDGVEYLNNLQAEDPISYYFDADLPDDTKSLLFEYGLSETTANNCLSLVYLLNYQKQIEYHRAIKGLTGNKKNSLIYNERFCYLYFVLLNLNHDFANRNPISISELQDTLLAHLREEHPELTTIFRNDIGGISFKTDKGMVCLRDNVFRKSIFDRIMQNDTLDVASGEFFSKNKI